MDKIKIASDSFFRYDEYLSQKFLVLNILSFDVDLKEKVPSIEIIFFLLYVVILAIFTGFVTTTGFTFSVWSVTGIVHVEVLFAANVILMVNYAILAIIGVNWLLFENKSVINEKLD
jgi:hypothetical protein